MIGANCTLRQGVTIGNREDDGPAPVLEDDVELGAYAQVLGGDPDRPGGEGRGDERGPPRRPARARSPSASRRGSSSGPRPIRSNPRGRPTDESRPDRRRAHRPPAPGLPPRAARASRSPASATCRGRWPSRPPSGSASRRGTPTTGRCSTRSGPTWSTSPPRRPRTIPWRWPRSTPGPTSSWRSRRPSPSTSSTPWSATPRARGRSLVEDYNYLYNGATRKILGLIESGEFGEVTHVEVFICLDILGEGSAFADPNAPHPCLSMAGGAIADFLTHLACLAHAFVGPHRKVSTSWSKRSRGPLPLGRDAGPGGGRAGDGAARLQRPHPARRLLAPGLRDEDAGDGRPVRDPAARSAGSGAAPSRSGRCSTAWTRRRPSGGRRSGRSAGSSTAARAPTKGSGPCWRETYRALGSGREPPITPRQVVEVNRLVADLTAEEYQL